MDVWGLSSCPSAPPDALQCHRASMLQHMFCLCPLPSPPSCQGPLKILYTPQLLLQQPPDP